MVTWTWVEPTATLRKYWKPKHWQVILQLSSAFFRPTRSVCFLPWFWDIRPVIGGVFPPPLQLYSSYREELGVFLYHYIFFSCRSVKGFKLHWQKYQNESVFFSSRLKLLALLAGCIFEFVLVDKLTVITRLYEPHGACSFKYCGYSSCIRNELWFLRIQLCWNQICCNRNCFYFM